MTIISSVYLFNLSSIPPHSSCKSLCSIKFMPIAVQPSPSHPHWNLLLTCRHSPFWMKLPWWLRWQRICLQGGRPGFHPWVRKIPWRRLCLPTPVFLPREFHGQRNLEGYSLWGFQSHTWLSHQHSLYPSPVIMFSSTSATTITLGSQHAQNAPSQWGRANEEVLFPPTPNSTWYLPYLPPGQSPQSYHEKPLLCNPFQAPQHWPLPLSLQLSVDSSLGRLTSTQQDYNWEEPEAHPYI